MQRRGGSSAPAFLRGWHVVLVASIILVFLTGAALLWIQHGSSVFFDTLTAGLGTCM